RTSRRARRSATRTRRSRRRPRCPPTTSLARIASVVAQREEASRRFFEEVAPSVPAPPSELAQWLPIIAPLLPRTELAVDLGTGEGSLLPLLSPIYGRVVAVDRS